LVLNHPQLAGKIHGKELTNTFEQLSLENRGSEEVKPSQTPKSKTEKPKRTILIKRTKRSGNKFITLIINLEDYIGTTFLQF
jgi:translation initiation factor 1 (eIF-1/SUI1)